MANNSESQRKRERSSNYRKCTYRYCTNRTGQGLSFFSYPSNPIKAAEWITACGREDLLVEKTLQYISKNYKVCEAHFHDYHILSNGRTKKQISTAAIPKPFVQPVLPSTSSASPAPSTLISIATQTSMRLSFNSPRKVKLRKKIRQLQTESVRPIVSAREAQYTKQDFLRMCDIYLKSALSKIVKKQVELQDKLPRERR